MKILIFILLLTQSLAHAGAESACRNFQEIQSIMKEIDRKGIEEVLPRAQWGDDLHRRHKRKQTTILIGKTIVLVVLKRLTFMAYIFEPTRLGVSSMTGHYVSSPENFARFLELSPRQGCMYLSMTDTHAHKLRQLTREFYRELDSAR